MRLSICLLLCLIVRVGSSHPSWGLAVANDGTIYFTDVLHGNGTLWQVNTKGELTELLTDFHAHNLHLDNDGALWLAENLYIEGKIEGEGRHTLLKIDQNKYDTLIVTEDIDQFSGTNVAITEGGTIYFENEGRIYQYTSTKPLLAIDYQFNRVKSIKAGPNGNLWISDSDSKGGALYRWSAPTGLKLVATQLIEANPKKPLFEEKNLQFISGIAFDNNGNTFTSENAGCRIVKIDKAGNKQVFHESPLLWSPVNVAFHEGDAYIMEVGYSKGHKGPRIVKKSANGQITRIVNIQTVPQEQIKHEGSESKFAMPLWVYFGVGLLIFSIVIVLAVRRQYKTP